MEKPILTRGTFDGKEINYSDLTQQHLSNIVWFNLIFCGDKNPLSEFAELDRRFDGQILPYKPVKEFEKEIEGLRMLGYLRDDGTIWYMGRKIGEVENKSYDNKS